MCHGIVSTSANISTLSDLFGRGSRNSADEQRNRETVSAVYTVGRLWFSHSSATFPLSIICPFQPLFERQSSFSLVQRTALLTLHALVISGYCDPLLGTHFIIMFFIINKTVITVVAIGYMLKINSVILQYKSQKWSNMIKECRIK